MKETASPLIELTRGDVIAHRVYRADNFWLRLRGLMGHPPLAPGEALWILPCQQAHTSFMPVPLDLVFLDRQLVVRRVVRNLRPWRISPWVRSAHSLLELTASDALRVQEGDRLGFAGAETSQAGGMTAK